MGEIGAQKCPLNVIGDPEADVKKIGATSNLSKFCGSNLVLFGAISLLSVVVQQRLSILKVSCRNYTTQLLGSGCGPKKGSSQEISRLWCVSSARLPLTPASAAPSAISPGRATSSLTQRQCGKEGGACEGSRQRGARRCS